MRPSVAAIDNIELDIDCHLQPYQLHSSHHKDSMSYQGSALITSMTKLHLAEVRATVLVVLGIVAVHHEQAMKLSPGLPRSSFMHCDWSLP